MAVMLSTSSTGNTSLLGKFLVNISVQRRSQHQAILRLEGICKLKKKNAKTSGIEPAIFRLVS
jgi:hypothetical protein